MKEKKQSWLERLMALFNLETVHHRICRLCHKRILKTHKYRHVKVGPFWVDQLEHKNCANPTCETPYQLAQRLAPELPFDRGAIDELSTPIWEEYDEGHQEKI
jgi:topoisomerase IA-like protein